MSERFIDSLQVHVRAGKGGNGAVHFDSRKYEAFGGPDGGDGGDGGSVVLVGDKNVDNLRNLEYAKLEAEHGVDGAGGLKKGSDARDFEIRVPLGTIAYEARTGAELGQVRETGEKLIIAQGGRGGKGNPKFATGSRRTPKIAKSGEQGISRHVELVWRIYAECMLLEPHETVLEEELLLPVLTGKDPAGIDYELYRRKPRWLRIRGLYEMFDVAYLPVVLFDDGELEQEQLRHAYWARRMFINLQPFGDEATAAWSGLAARLKEVRFRRLEKLVLAAQHELPLDELELDVESTGRPELSMVRCKGPAEVHEIFMGQLSGGVVN